MAKPSVQQYTPLGHRYYRVRRFMRRKGILVLFLMPLVLILGVFLLYPLGRAAWMSVSYWHVVRPIPEGNPFVGFSNYSRVFSSSRFVSSVWITLTYIVGTVAARYVVGLGGAMLLNKPFRGRSFMRVIAILPWSVPVVVTCLLWLLMLDTQVGIINYILESIGIIARPISWLGNVHWALPSAMVVNVWKGYPWAIVMLLAGLQSIPFTMYEAAIVDGANAWQKFWHITLPMLRPVSAIVFLLLVIWTVKDFAILYVLTGGGPANATELLTVYVYRRAFNSFQMGEAAAGGMVLLLFSLLFSVIYLKISRGESQTW